jgi:hypothetical protein
VLDGFSSDNHRVWRSIEPGLHGFKYVFMLPTLQALCLFRCATRPESAGVVGKRSKELVSCADLSRGAAAGACLHAVHPAGDSGRFTLDGRVRLAARPSRLRHDGLRDHRRRKSPGEIGRVIGFSAFGGNVAGSIAVIAASRFIAAGTGFAPIFFAAPAAYALALLVFLRLFGDDFNTQFRVFGKRSIEERQASAKTTS